MLLQKTGWRIKQFISHRRSSSLENSNNKFQDTSFTEKRPSTSSRRLSWLSQSPPHSETSTLRRANSNATTGSQLISQTPKNDTAHSSASSLCSCECGPHPVSVEHSLFRVEPLRAQPEILYLPHLPPSNASGDARTWRLIFSEDVSQPLAPRSPRLATVRMTTTTTDSTFDLLEALGIEPLDEDKTPTQSILNTEDLDSDELSENVEQLIRETDEAFQAVGTALVHAKAATQGWYDTTTTSPHKARGILRKYTQQNSAFKVPVSRSISGPKGKRKKPIKKKVNILGRTARTVPPPPANTPSRWTLNDVTANMADVFSGKMFRTEPDEMLTPGRMHRLRHYQESERKASMESARSTETDGFTPTDPFHLESLSTRITAAQRGRPPSPCPIRPPPAVPQRRFQGKNLMDRQVKFEDQLVPSDASVADTGMVFKELNFPSPPRTPRNRSDSRGAPSLPTIPEIFPLHLTPVKLPDPEVQPRPLSTKLPENFITLRSTPFTLTSPLFCHGPIRIERTNREYATTSPQDEALDWTAFQMAILGTMDEDGGDQRDDWEWEADELELDGIMAWFEGFGFEGFGALEGPPPREPLLQDEDKEVVMQPRSWRSRVDAEKIVDESRTGTGRRTWANSFGALKNMEGLEVGSGIVEAMKRRPSLADSLPPSPMLDLVVCSPHQAAVEVIPMGYNLGHDLGDFLNWEAKNVQTLFGDDK